MKNAIFGKLFSIRWQFGLDPSKMAGDGPVEEGDVDGERISLNGQELPWFCKVGDTYTAVGMDIWEKLLAR